MIEGKEYRMKVDQISSKLLELVDESEDMTTGDIQGCIEAQVMIAIQPGKDMKQCQS